VYLPMKPVSRWYHVAAALGALGFSAIVVWHFSSYEIAASDRGMVLLVTAVWVAWSLTSGVLACRTIRSSQQGWATFRYVGLVLAAVAAVGVVVARWGVGERDSKSALFWVNVAGIAWSIAWLYRLAWRVTSSERDPLGR
jgi:hypothetical protein